MASQKRALDYNAIAKAYYANPLKKYRQRSKLFIFSLLPCVLHIYLFRLCSGLASIYVYAEKLPEMGYGVFGNCDAKKCTVYVPKGTYDDYWLSDFGYFFENIVEFDATGIDKTTTSTDVEEVSRYSVNGQRLVGPTKGLNIVKYSDGSVKKVAVE